MSTTYIAFHAARPDGYTARHRRPARTQRIGLAVLGAVWLIGSAVGTLAATGVVR